MQYPFAYLCHDGVDPIVNMMFTTSEDKEEEIEVDAIYDYVNFAMYYYWL